jgi:hypothetical protein
VAAGIPAAADWRLNGCPIDELITATVFHRLEPTIEKDVDMDGVGEVEYLYRVGRECAQGVDWPAML